MVTMSAVWDRTTEFLGDNLAAVIGIAAVTIYLPAAAQDVLQPLAATAEPGAKLGLALLSLALSMLSVFGQVALIALALDPALGRGGAFRRAATRFGPMLAVSIVLLVALFALLIPPALAMAIDGVDVAALSGGVAPNLSPGTALLIVLYFLILVPVLLWVGARLAVVGPVVVAERRGLGAIGHAFGLTRGLAGKIVGVIILFGIVAVVAVLAAKTVFGSVFRIALGGDGAVTAATVLTALVTALVAAGFTVVITTFFTKLYVAVRDRTEAAPATA